MVVSLGVFTLIDAIAKYLSRDYPVPGLKIGVRAGFSLARRIRP
jgi:hypothetical protein